MPVMRRRLLVVGAGPAGLALAAALRGSGIETRLFERAPTTALAEPAFDGREIALTHASQGLLRQLGVWDAIPADQRFPLRQARVLDGASPFALDIGPDGAEAATGEPLGLLVSNHLIRRALYARVADDPAVTIQTGATVANVTADARAARVTLDDGQEHEGDLVVAADARLSATREQLGINASIRPMDQTIVVVRVAIARPHDGIATEWFDGTRAVAILPLAEGHASAVLTMTPDEAAAAMALDPPALSALVTDWTHGRWGAVTTTGAPHSYPVTMTYADRFWAPRAVLVGDAAVGMHPVTAHGFNYGLAGAVRLGRLLTHARDIGAAEPLRRYAAQHRAATWPLYTASLGIVGLYGAQGPAARVARQAVLRLGALSPVRRTLGAVLMDRR